MNNICTLFLAEITQAVDPGSVLPPAMFALKVLCSTMESLQGVHISFHFLLLDKVQIGSNFYVHSSEVRKKTFDFVQFLLRQNVAS